MTERELSIIRALGEEFSTVLADLQRTFEGKDGLAGTSV
ncbi:putative portal protein [Escherichia coli]|nr:putative portal protein [Escherichia coli]